jgi:uncharacterized protein HemX
MGFLNGLLSGPLPSAVAIIIAIMMGAGYYFFVLPLVSDHAALRKKNDELTGELSNNAAVLAALAEIKKLCQDQASGLSVELLPKLAEQQQSLHKALREIQTLVAEVQTKTTRADDEMNRELERIVRIISEINDKQSQVSGVILGLTMSHAHNPARGI